MDGNSMIHTMRVGIHLLEVQVGLLRFSSTRDFRLNLRPRRVSLPQLLHLVSAPVLPVLAAPEEDGSGLHIAVRVQYG